MAPATTAADRNTGAGLLVLGIAVVAWALHGWSLGLPFLAEDFGCLGRLYREAEVTGWARLLAFFDPVETDQQVFFRPLADLLMGVDLRLWGTDPTGFHVTNLLLIAGTGGLLALVAQHLTGSRIAAAVAGGVLVTSPLVLENTVWALGRDGLLPLLCTLLAAHAALTRDRGRFAIAGWYLAACLAKEWAVAMAPVLVALRTHRHTGGVRPRLAGALRDTVWIWPALLAYLGLRVSAIDTLVGGYAHGAGGLLSGTFWASRLDFVIALLVPLPETVLAGAPRYAAALAVATVVGTGLAIDGRRHGPSSRWIAGGCGLWLLACLAVHASVAFDPRTLADSRYLAPGLPAVGLLLGLAIRGYAGASRRRAVGLAAGLLVGLAVATVDGATEWARAGTVTTRLRDDIHSRIAAAPDTTLRVHGIPGTLGRARVGFALPAAFAPPFWSGPGSRVELFSDLYTPHHGVRRTASLLILLDTLLDRPADVAPWVFDRQTLRIRPVDDPTVRYEVRGVLAPAGGGPLARLACTELGLEFAADVPRPAAGTPLILRGPVIGDGAARRLRVEAVATAAPLARVLPAPGAAGEFRMEIRHRPASYYALLVAEHSRVLPLPGFGLALTGSRRPVHSGFVDRGGTATIPLGRIRPTDGVLQVVLFDSEGGVTLSGCICSW